MSIGSEKLKTLPVFKHFASLARAEEVALVNRHTDYIIPQMERYVETFPRYTLHNTEHICNVITIMGELLGDSIKLLTALEAGILILSAVYHDYGMIFTNEERLDIDRNPDILEEFLSSEPRARIIFCENNFKVTAELEEWYCRSCHAKRVWIKLAQMESSCGQLLWTGIPFRIALGNVCESHNEEIEKIRTDNSRFDTNFQNECDLRFCALLLRLADILDFDNSRSPLSVYEYLNLDSAESPFEMTSQIEWNKHMCSSGFNFKKISSSRELPFLASPQNPMVEQAIRKFLDIIDVELKSVNVTLPYCCSKWQGVQFPLLIDRSNLMSHNYISGDFRFSLSEDKILDLLTGEDLYGDSFIFVRELLQNAIDTVRHRAFIERMRSKDFEPSGISVSFFNDSKGYKWLRIDDDGMGMNLEIIKGYLLQKGNSFYNSDLFKIEQLRIKQSTHEDFKPISRFGIGLLSCFMACDKVEISTCYFYEYDKHKRERLRLSIAGRSGFWSISAEHMRHDPPLMPCQEGFENSYRKNPGTSIACRLKTGREFSGLNMQAIVENFLLAPEIPVLFDGIRLGGDLRELAHIPWCNDARFTLPDDFLKRCSEILDLSVASIIIELKSINLHQKANTPNLTGQLVLVIPRITLSGLDEHVSSGKFFRLTQDLNNTEIVCERTVRNSEGRESKLTEKFDISNIIANINIPQKLRSARQHQNFSWPSLSHNGIVIFDSEQQLDLHLVEFDQYRERFQRHPSFYLFTGLFCFRDSLLPNVTISRNKVKNFSDEVVANVLFATRELNAFTPLENFFSYFPKMEKGIINRFTVATFESIKIYNDNKTYFDELQCFYVKELGMSSLNGIATALSNGPVSFLIRKCDSDFFFQLQHYMIEVNFSVKYVGVDGYYHLEASSLHDRAPHYVVLKQFQPLTFIDCDDPTKVNLLNGSLNRSHRLCRWLMKWSQLLEQDFQYFMIQLMNELLSSQPSKNKAKLANSVLERLSELLPKDAKPGSDLNLSEADFNE
jgi:hypothetical protein